MPLPDEPPSGTVRSLTLEMTSAGSATTASLVKLDQIEPGFLASGIGLDTERQRALAASRSEGGDVLYPQILGHLRAGGANRVGLVIQHAGHNLHRRAVRAVDPDTDRVGVLVAGGVDVGPDGDGRVGHRSQVDGVESDEAKAVGIVHHENLRTVREHATVTEVHVLARSAPRSVAVGCCSTQTQIYET